MNKIIRLNWQSFFEHFQNLRVIFLKIKNCGAKVPVFKGFQTAPSGAKKLESFSS
jgi:hypothetical protein